MDVELARTFLAVVETGSFLGAAEKVHVTQSTVSVRIKSLEDQLRRPLFERGKSGATLTSAGRHFQRHAQAILRSWSQAKLDVALPDEFESALEIGAQHSLWDSLLIDALFDLRSALPSIALKASMGYSDVLMEELINGTLDLAIIYSPERREGFCVERLFEDEFVLVTSDPDTQSDPFGENYVFVDWGPEFRADHLLNFPALATPSVQIGLGTLGLRYLESHAASGYFPAHVVKSGARDSRLRIVEDAPRFAYSAYAVMDENQDETAARTAVNVLKAFARQRAASV